MGQRQFGTDYPICKWSTEAPSLVDRCTDPIQPLLKELSPLERKALLLFEECEEQWEWSGGGMGPRVRDGIPFERVESAARAKGFPWTDELKDLFRKCVRLLLKQQNDFLKAEAIARRAAAASGNS